MSLRAFFSSARLALVCALNRCRGVPAAFLLRDFFGLATPLGTGGRGLLGTALFFLGTPIMERLR